MFESAIERAAKFTRAIHTVARYYRTNILEPIASTLILVNSDGWALTAKHVGQILLAAEKVGVPYKALLGARSGKQKKSVKKLERELGLSKSKVIEIKNRFMGCCDGYEGFEIKLHPDVDLVLVRFKCKSVSCSSFPIFAENHDNMKQGMELCRLGFPFPEFANYEYNKENDEIRWTDVGREGSPIFPRDGMLTRMVVQKIGGEDALAGFELSTPGLKGQSGGPVIDAEARVWGMQVTTSFLPLDFHPKVEIIREGRRTIIEDEGFMYVGRCIHVKLMKDFMTQHKVRFQKG